MLHREHRGADPPAEKRVYDLLLCSRSGDEEVEQVPLASEPIVVVAHRDAPPPPRRWAELARLPLIGYEENSVMDNTLQGIAEDHGTRFQFLYRAPTETAIVALVAHGLGYAVIAWSEEETRGGRWPATPWRMGSTPASCT